MVRFQKLTIHLTRAQCTPSAIATVQVSHALPAVRFSCLLRGRGASFQDGVTAGKGFPCAPFWGVQICAWFIKDACAWCVFSKPCTKLTLHCNHRSGYLKTEHTESLFLLTPSWKQAPRPRSKHEKRTAGSAWETCTVVAADGVRCARVKLRDKFIVNFWNHTVLLCISCI